MILLADQFAFLRRDKDQGCAAAKIRIQTSPRSTPYLRDLSPTFRVELQIELQTEISNAGKDGHARNRPDVNVQLFPLYRR